MVYIHINIYVYVHQNSKMYLIEEEIPWLR